MQKERSGVEHTGSHDAAEVTVPRVRTDLVERLLGDPAQVHVIVARGSRFHLRSWTPPLCAHKHTHECERTREHTREHTKHNVAVVGRMLV